MTKKEDCEDLFPTEPEPTGQFDNDYVPDDALPLCPKCLKPCQPLAYYCDKCGSNDAINPLTPYIPFLNIRFNYDIFCTMWRKIWYEKNTPAVRKLFYLFMFIPLGARGGLYAPIVLLMVGLPVFLIYKIPQKQVRKAILAALVAVIIVLLVLYAFSGPPR
jgi:hypothetical protein